MEKGPSLFRSSRSLIIDALSLSRWIVVAIVVDELCCSETVEIIALMNPIREYCNIYY